MKRAFLYLAVGFIATLSLAWFPHGTLNIPVTNTFVSLSIGGGGWVVGQDLSTAGVRFARTDVGGGYIWNPNTNAWVQFICAACIPANATSGAQNFGYYPPTGGSQTYQNVGGGGGGVIEVAGAPSNSSVAYLNLGAGHILVATNVSPTSTPPMTWTEIGHAAGGGFPSITDASNGSCRMNGRAMAVDPNNVDHVLVATQTGGVWETLNGTSGSPPTWTQIPTGSVPTGTMYVAFDPTASVVGGLTQTAYIFTTGGTAGVYTATNIGTAGSAVSATWALAAASGPTTVQHMIVNGDVSHGGGDVWVVDGPCGDGSGGVWKLHAGTWTHPLATASYHAIAINPNNGNHIAVIKDGGLNIAVALDGATFAVYSAALPTATDAPWQGWMAGNYVYLSAGDINFDPLQTDVLLFDGGQGFWTMPLPSASSWSWNSMVAGIEEMESQQIISVAAYKPLMGFQDLAGCQLNVATNAYPTSCVPIAGTQTLSFMSGQALVPGTNLTVAKIGVDPASVGADYSGTSADGFKSSYVPFNNGWIATVAPSALCGGSCTSGNVTVMVPSTTGLASWSAGSGSIVCTRTTALVNGVTNNLNSTSSYGGGTNCYPVTVTSSTGITLLNSIANSSLNNAGFGSYQLWLYPTTLLNNWTGGLNVTNVTNSSGSVQVTTATGNLMQNNSMVCISGVVMTTTTVVNGCWIATSFSSNHFVLYGSTWVGGDSYSSGGAAASFMPPGGGIAAAGATNFAMIPQQNNFPQCTTDGGQTWTQMSYSSITGPTTGWGGAETNQQYSITADQVTPNTFYAVNITAGLFSWTNCGSPAGTLPAPVNSNVSQWAGQAANMKLKAWPGEAGHLFFVAGNGGTGHPSGGTQVWRSCDGGVNMWRLPNVFDARSVGYGAAAAGQSYSAIYVAGWVDTTGANSTSTVSGPTFSIWRSVNDLNHGVSGACNVGGPVTAGKIDNNGGGLVGNTLTVTTMGGGATGGYNLGVGNVISYDAGSHVAANTTILGGGASIVGGTGSAASCNGTPCTGAGGTGTYLLYGSAQLVSSEAMVLSANTWVNICNKGSPTSQCWPGGWMGPISDIAGDAFVYGPVYISTGWGGFWGNFNFLLNRDLNPASNDNTPAFLEKAA